MEREPVNPSRPLSLPEVVDKMLADLKHIPNEGARAYFYSVLTRIRNETWNRHVASATIAGVYHGWGVSRSFEHGYYHLHLSTATYCMAFDQSIYGWKIERWTKGGKWYLLTRTKYLPNWNDRKRTRVVDE